MLRIAPAHPPLWLTPTSLQFGVEAVARLDDVTPWQERVLDALNDGVAESMLVALAVCFGATRDDAVRFSDAIRPALARRDPPPLAVVIEFPPGMRHDETAAFTQAVTSTGVQVADARDWPGDPEGHPVVVVASRLLDPRRAAALTRADAVHLPVELWGDTARVGPVIVPGRTACAACLHAHRTDRDPQWPLLASQLLGRPPLATDPDVLLDAALVAARLLRTHPHLGGERRRQGADLRMAGDPVDASLSVSLAGATVHRSWRAHRPHERCLCRSPEGSATADAPGGRWSAPTTSRGFARPA